MIKDEKPRLFEFQYMKIDEIHSFDLEAGASVRIGEIMYTTNLISKVEFVKRKLSSGESLFINIFMGNLKLGCIVSLKEDYVFEKSSNFREYTIRKAEQFDYPIKINPLERVHQ